MPKKSEAIFKKTLNLRMSRPKKSTYKKKKSKSSGIDSDDSFDYEEDEQKQLDDIIKDNEVIVHLGSQDVFRVPLMWMMHDSLVDIHIMKKLEDSDLDDEDNTLLLFESISRIFNKTAKDQDSLDFTLGLSSRTIELNKDFYASMDV
mmetsp:Transcript_18162/g.27941  ORF Transcript_18162/g.27941 Transcript_18162/m.27941 type:complete len:147 (+) Transcript_18162:6795-7235(+)